MERGKKSFKHTIQGLHKGVANISLKIHTLQTLPLQQVDSIISAVEVAETHEELTNTGLSHYPIQTVLLILQSFYVPASSFVMQTQKYFSSDT